MVIRFLLLVLIVGLLMYVLAQDAKIVEVGRMMFFLRAVGAMPQRPPSEGGLCSSDLNPRIKGVVRNFTGQNSVLTIQQPGDKKQYRTKDAFWDKLLISDDAFRQIIRQHARS